MPGSKIRILSTRPLGVALLEQAVGKGIRIDTLSFISTEPIRDQALMEKVQALGKQSLTAVFTSMNAVEAVAAEVATRHVPWKIFCIGAATRQLVHEHFGESAIAGTAPSAAELADEVLRWHPSEVFFFCGDQRRDELPDKLSAAGIQVHEAEVYRTTQTPHVVERKYNGVLFFSPSAVHSFFSVNKLTETAICFAIGSTTAAAIRQYCANPVVTSETPEKNALVYQLIDYFQTNI